MWSENQNEVNSKPASHRPAGQLESFAALPSASNIAALIEDVKRQRNEILKINSDLKSAKSNVDKRSLEELKMKQELMTQIRNLKRERDDAVKEDRNSAEKLRLAERRIAEMERTIEDLRAQNSDFLKQLQEKFTEVSDLKFAISKMQFSIDAPSRLTAKEEDSQKKVEKQREEAHKDSPVAFPKLLPTSDSMTVLQEKANAYLEKFRQENERAIKLEKQVLELSAARELLLAEKTALKKENQRLEASSERKPKNLSEAETSSSKSDPKSLEEMRRDLEAFEIVAEAFAEYEASAEAMINLISSS